MNERTIRMKSGWLVIPVAHKPVDLSLENYREFCSFIQLTMIRATASSITTPMPIDSAKVNAA